MYLQSNELDFNKLSITDTRLAGDGEANPHRSISSYN